MGLVPIYEYFQSGITLEQFDSIHRAAKSPKIYMSIITGRCGSTLVSHVASKLGFGSGTEFFNDCPEELLEQVAGRDQFDKFLHVLFEENTIDGRFYLQVDPFRLEAMYRIIPKAAWRFSQVDNLNIFLRKDILAQALSYVNAIASGVWHSHQPASAPDPTAEFSTTQALFWIEHIHRMERKIAEMFPEARPSTYYYEDIAADPVSTISTFFRNFGFAAKSHELADAIQDVRGPKKLVRNNFMTQYGAVLEKYPWIAEVLAERTAGTIPSPKLEHMLAQKL